MPNIVKITSETPDEILNAGSYGAGAVIRLQWSATETGTFADVSGTGSTPTVAVVAGTRIYTGYDPLGTVSTWYRERYENVGATRLSDWTPVFQVADETAGLLASLYDAKQRLGIDPSTTTEDENLLEIITQVSAEIHGYTGRRFARSPSSGTSTFYFDVERTGRVLRIPQGIASMTTLEVATSSQPETGGTFTTVPAAEWFLRPVTAERSYGWPATSVHISDLSSSYFADGYNTVRAVMALGFASVPYDIQAVALSAVVRNHMSKGAPGGVTALAGPTGQMVILRGIGPQEMQTLDRYRVPNA